MVAVNDDTARFRAASGPSGRRPLVVIIDNYDSFTYNLAQAFARLGPEVEVHRNDRISVRTLLRRGPDYLVVSPGPGRPGASGRSGAISDVGISDDAMATLRGRVPVLGVCLGHQILARQLGGRVVPTGVPVHGKRDRVFHDGDGIFAELPQPCVVARYHSLAVPPDSLPAAIPVCAWNGDGVVMGLGVPGEATWSVQFHPESYMTPEGDRLLAAFLDGVICAPKRGRSAGSVTVP
ncbi:MAG: aminodeoxychorismate/anthranilate synthase component II [Planctomycetes bacterium]|nr:aminodeoxychorismate/anthranilate synthase component II [Planctomycetota bacterium]